MTRNSFRVTLLAALFAFAATGIVSAQNNNGQRITPSFKDAEIGQVIEAVAAATGKTIIPDPRVRAQVTMLSQTPMTPGRVLRSVPGAAVGAPVRRRGIRRHHQDRAGRQRAADAEHRPALAREVGFR